MRARPLLAVVSVEDQAAPGVDLDFWGRALSPSPAEVPAHLRQSVADFWDQCTYGEIRPRVHHTLRLRITADDPDWRKVRESEEPGPEQSLAARRLCARALRANRSVLASIKPSLFVLISSLPVARAFSVPGPLRPPWPVAVLAQQSTHTTFCHELGHLFNYGHPWGLRGDHPSTHDGEYGSPYCVMGMASRQPEVCRTLAPWPGAAGTSVDPQFFSAAGPRLSHASFLATRNLLRGRPGTRSIPAPEPGQVLDLELTDPGGPEGLPRGILIEYADHHLSVEVRRPRPERVDFMDWDARLDLRRRGVSDNYADRDLHDGPGVIVHRIHQDRSRSRLPWGWGSGPGRVTYLGNIPLPPSGTRDLHVDSGAHLTVLSDDGDRVVVQLGEGPVRARTEICATYPAGRRDRGAVRPWRVALHGHAYGGNGHALTWEVGGLRLSDIKPGVWIRRSVPLPMASGAPAQVPQLQVEVAWDELTLQIDPWPVAFDLPVRLSVSGEDQSSTEHVIRVPPSRSV